MNFTREQFNKEIVSLDMDDLPFNLTRDQQFELFNLLPSEIQGEAIKWGSNDTEFREKLMGFILEKYFDMTFDQYYQSEIALKYFADCIPLELDFNKLK